MNEKKTKIVCTIGPASETPEMIRQLISAGMNVARLNFSHGNYAEYSRIIKTIRSVSAKMKQTVAIMQDLQGPKIRIGEMPKEGVWIKEGQKLTLTTKEIMGNEKEIPVQYKNLPKDIDTKDRILINDGMIELKVKKVKKEDIECEVTTGGLVKSHKGINVPTASISANPITEKDKQDLIFGIKNDIDYVALSFVKNAKNIRELRELIRLRHGKVKIIAKIERHEAIDNMEEIIHEADGVMVARGDLGVEIPAENVPVIQKNIIRMATIHGKPVITATEMLQSMIENPRATRAEISDVANAVFDHTDAIMLSNETAVGKYPIQAVQTMTKVSLAIEKEMNRRHLFLQNKLFEKDIPLSFATCTAAADWAKNIGAKLMVASTSSGFTAQQIAKHRIHIPLIVITEDPKVRNQLQMVWGINKVIVKKINPKNHLKEIRKLLVDKRMVHKDDKVIVVANLDKNEKHISTIVI